MNETGAWLTVPSASPHLGQAQQAPDHVALAVRLAVRLPQRLVVLVTLLAVVSHPKLASTGADRASRYVLQGQEGCKAVNDTMQHVFMHMRSFLDA